MSSPNVFSSRTSEFCWLPPAVEAKLTWIREIPLKLTRSSLDTHLAALFGPGVPTADFLRQRLECIEKFDARVLMPPDNMPTNVPGEAIIYPHRIDIRNVDNSINSSQIFYFSYYLNERHRGEIPNTQTRASTIDGSIALQRRYFVEIWRKVNYKLQCRSVR